MRTLHLVGSAVNPFWADLSTMYAARCLELTEDEEAVIAYVAPGGRWSFPPGLDADALAAAESLPLPAALEHLAELEVDVMVPHLFDRPGMTAYRGLFDVLGLPYVGNPPEVTALAADKARTKAVVAGAGVLVPAGEVVRAGGLPSLELPVVVKPVDSDNSFGVTLVRDADDLSAALDAALEHSDGALVEAYVELGREVRCGLLERDGELVALPLEEYAVDTVRGYADKLAPAGTSGLRLVAKETTKAWMVAADDPLTGPVQAVARDCHRALGCRDYSLFDFRVDPEGSVYFLEAGLYCSFSDQSVIAMMAKAAGIELSDLYTAALTGAMHR